ncbi:hypothetical protein Q6312_28215 [Klebsiella pneumoniae]|nr:hypothetical protein [Klebsiella pneumoniae]MDP1249849.1 hypothetical protein [Klebsiella pneumoniae]
MEGLGVGVGVEIFIDGVVVSVMTGYQGEICIVFQISALFPHLTVEKKVVFGLRMGGVP